jgi:MAP3K TRAFs-binding domain
MSSSEAMRDLCFVVMPFGTKSDAAGPVAFDAVYKQIIAPAIDAAGLEPLRADEEMSGGIIHKPMFERLLLCRFAVADLTTANANVFYELGVRHAARPGATVLIFAEGRGQLPFDVAPLRAMPYKLDASGAPADPAAAVKLLTERLQALRDEEHANARGVIDSPMSHLIENYSFPDIARLKTDVFRERVDYARGIKEKLAAARGKGLDAVREIEKELGDLDDVEHGALVDLFLSYRAVKGWTEMIALAERMPKPLAQTIMVREQLALALNRAGDDARAETIALEVLSGRGPSSETYGIIGRIYKDRWERAVKAGQKIKARALLDQAIDAYRKGFEADWRDAYPGINAVTLMELREPPDPARVELIPVVRYAVTRRLAAATPDYWDHATLLELSVLANDPNAAADSLGKALIAMREKWEGETTARNLGLIADSRAARGEEVEWIRDCVRELTA